MGSSLGYDLNRYFRFHFFVNPYGDTVGAKGFNGFLEQHHSFFNDHVLLADLDILGETLGRENCFGAVKGKVAPGPMTYFRISTDDQRGVITSYLGQGEFTDDPFDMDGGIVVCKVSNLRVLLAFICQNGFEHHVAMTRGHVADVLEEAIGKYLGWELYHHRG